VRLSRREFVCLGLGCGAGALGASLLELERRQPAGLVPAARVAVPYAHGAEPPASLGPRALDAVTYPPPPRDRGATHAAAVDLWVSEQPVEVARSVTMNGWTFNGAIPGPVIRATEGDEVAIHLRNLGARSHNLHLHGRHDVSEDGWEPIPPGGEATYHITAGPFGLHPYHCDTAPAAEHLSRGLFGMFIVDPPGGRQPAHEVALVLSGFDVNSDGHNELYGWNGVAGFYDRFPIKVPVGELVRVYLLNMVADDPIASFHLHAEAFDVYRSGTRLTPDETTDVVTLAQTERAIVEFRLSHRGRYMFHPHHRPKAEHGALAWFAAI
jgi:nitrite reductase (NO-forming)